MFRKRHESPAAVPARVTAPARDVEPAASLSDEALAAVAGAATPACVTAWISSGFTRRPVLICI